MKYLISSLLILFSTLQTINCLHGADVSTLLSVAKWECLLTNGYSYALPRAYRSSGSVDLNIIENLKNGDH